MLFSILIYILVLVLIIRIYCRLTIGRCKSQICLVGKTAIVTGANAGIGYETALDFAKRGAKVILACRDEKRANTAKTRIIHETGNENIVVELIDMSSFDSVRAFAKKIKETESRLDILVNNAGVGDGNGAKTKDGHYLVMQVNYFSTFLLTNLLIDLLKKTKNARIVNVSSILGRIAFGFGISKIDKELGLIRIYSFSKLCLIFFTKELAKKLQGTGITVYSLHPGAIRTEIFNPLTGFWKYIANLGKLLFFRTSEEGAQTTIYCSIAKDIEALNGEHFQDCERVRPYETSVFVPDGYPEKVWKATKDIIQLKPEEDPFSV